MEFRFVTLACLLFVAACSKPGAPKAKAGEAGDVVAAKPALVEQPVGSATAMPAEIGVFVARREQCDHFRGEEAYDEERGRFLRAQLEKTCKGTDAELAELKRTYAARDDVMARLSEFETTIE